MAEMATVVLTAVSLVGQSACQSVNGITFMCRFWLTVEHPNLCKSELISLCQLKHSNKNISLKVFVYRSERLADLCST